MKKECIIEGCPDEVILIAKFGGKSYYSCKKHKDTVLQIISAENKDRS